MQAVGRLGSYISKSVCTVSGTFHPFGGAVDIIVVKQPDGSYKSSPWYVRFGKFQGMLKTKEKVVGISVNGVESDFHMHLDHKGEAYFIVEVSFEEEGPLGSSEEMDMKPGNRWPIKSKGCNCNADWSASSFNKRNTNAVGQTNSRRSQILGFVFGRRSKKENEIDEDASCAVRADSLERAELAADLLELKWSTNLDFSKLRRDGSKCLKSEYVSQTATPVKSAKEDIHPNDALGINNADDQVESVNMSSETEKYDARSLNSMPDISFLKDENVKIQAICDPKILESSEVELAGSIEQTHASLCHGNRDEVSELNMTKSISEAKSEAEGDLLHGQETFNSQECFRKGDQFTIVSDKSISVGEATLYTSSESITTDSHCQMSCVDCVASCIPTLRNSEEEHLLFGKLGDLSSGDDKSVIIIHADPEVKEPNSSLSMNAADEFNETSQHNSFSGFLSEQSVINGSKIQQTRLRTIHNDAGINATGNPQSKGYIRMARSLPKTRPLCDSALDSGHSFYCSLNSDVKSGVSNVHHDFGLLSMVEDVKILKENICPAKNIMGNPPASIDSLKGIRRDWPLSFKRSRSVKVSQPGLDDYENFDASKIVKNADDLDCISELTKVKRNKKELRTLVPTSEQLESLNLKEGRNIVVFTFSTAMLGRQQVNAQIFLWRWDTQIVISDVDGTITRSDLLGQVMPLVGMDWSQTGVTHLFSSIKENGYQLLFLSARSISQAFYTRQFLFNINQDGKALPDGPVIISPDGLFPSLFREVVRRRPHEFKIACLEDIKALFPMDKNPFYAGFGNRDTDEFSYLKVGIPRGKIFIINPKGEIVVNRRVDTKSYMSLHSLVHGMFPLVSSCELEDFNSWNYWKLPSPLIEV